MGWSSTSCFTGWRVLQTRTRAIQSNRALKPRWLCLTGRPIDNVPAWMLEDLKWLNALEPEMQLLRPAYCLCPEDKDEDDEEEERRSSSPVI